MTIPANSVAEYISNIPDNQQDGVNKLLNFIRENLPSGFEECLSYGMIGYVVPHSIYPAGYHCNPKLPLPFFSVAAQKNFIAFYHMGIYADPVLLAWFTTEYAKLGLKKLDMGKSCMRFKTAEDIPYALIGTLVSTTSPAEWIKTYETAFLKAK
jgi:uncharacterized protein YdhG (YjbR/CyaY superfamily)